MPYQIHWDNPEQTVIRQVFSDKLSVDDFREAIKNNASMMQSVDHPVDLIMVLNLRKNVAGFLQAAKYAEVMMPDNQRMVIVVGAHGPIKMLLNIARQINPAAAQNLYFANTVEEAYNIIRVMGKKMSS